MTGDEFSSLNVMVIEDEAFSQQVVAKVLEKVGVASVTAAKDGAEALEMLSRAKPKIDLVICDIEMPVMGGYEFVRQVRFGTVPGYKDISIIMLTGKDTDENTQRALLHRINGFLVKPARPKTLGDTIRRALKNN